MPESIRALVFISVFATFVFAFAKQPLCDKGIIVDEATYKRDRNIWFAVTAIVFLAHNFWLYVIAVALLLNYYRSRHDNPFALYCLVLFAAPAFSKQIPGIGPIDHIVSVDYYRLLNVMLLLPMAISLSRKQKQRLIGMDVFVIAALTWMALIHLVSDRPTLSVRSVLYFYTDSWLPYYVASRAVTSIHDFRRVAGALIVALVILALIGAFEAVRHWLLFDSLRAALGIPLEIMEPTYLLRGGGLLRANASLGNSIALGYVMMLGLSLWLFLQPLLAPKWKARSAGATLFAGLISGLSRGPWVGTATMLTTFTLVGRGAGKRIFAAIGVVGLILLVLMITPLGDVIIPYLPFVGTVETGNIDYRARLFDVSMLVFNQNPFVGDLFYMRNPIMEQMRQGQGIIDIVNTYLQLALPYGAIGLAFFLGIFAAAWRSVSRVRASLDNNPEAERLARSLLAGLIGILVTIATVSSISVIPTMYWVWAGLCAAYVRTFRTQPAYARARGARAAAARGTSTPSR